jgi:tetratricopeptide (TPR) repeat protein
MKILFLSIVSLLFLTAANGQKAGVADISLSTLNAGLSGSDKLESNYYLLKGQNALYYQEYRDALSHAKDALRLDENNKAALVLAGDAYSALEKTKRALRYYRRAISLGVDDPELLYKVGITNMQSGNYLDAINNFEKAIILQPEHAGYYMKRGEAKMKIELYASAIEDFNKVLSFNEQDVSALRNKGVCYREIGNYIEAPDILTKAIELDEGAPRNFIEPGKTYLKAYNKNKACQDFHKAAALKSATAEQLKKEHCQ